MQYTIREVTTILDNCNSIEEIMKAASALNFLTQYDPYFGTMRDRIRYFINLKIDLL